METQENSCTDYIGDVTSQLARIARDEGSEGLAFLLEMAALEANGPRKLRPRKFKRLHADTIRENGHTAQRR